MYFRFFIFRVWLRMIFFYHNGCWAFNWIVRSSTVTEHKKLAMILVCILIDIIHATPYVLPVHSISSEFWSAFCSLYRTAFDQYFHRFRCVYVGHQLCLSKNSSKQKLPLAFYSPNSPKVRERDLSLNRELITFFFFQLSTAVRP